MKACAKNILCIYLAHGCFVPSSRAAIRLELCKGGDEPWQTRHPFETACEVFFDPFACDVDASVEAEDRFAAIGETKTHNLLFVVHAIREDGWIRIISARPAEAAERKLYEDGD